MGAICLQANERSDIFVYFQSQAKFWLQVRFDRSYGMNSYRKPFNKTMKTRSKNTKNSYKKQKFLTTAETPDVNNSKNKIHSSYNFMICTYYSFIKKRIKHSKKLNICIKTQLIKLLKFTNGSLSQKSRKINRRRVKTTVQHIFESTNSCSKWEARTTHQIMG